VRTPVVAIFGPTDPARCGPWLSEIEPVQMDIDCIRCYRKRCWHLRCMRLADADEIMARVACCITLGQKI